MTKTVEINGSMPAKLPPMKPHPNPAEHLFRPTAAYKHLDEVWIVRLRSRVGDGNAGLLAPVGWADGYPAPNYVCRFAPDPLIYLDYYGPQFATGLT